MSLSVASKPERRERVGGSEVGSEGGSEGRSGGAYDDISERVTKREGE